MAGSVQSSLCRNFISCQEASVCFVPLKIAHPSVLAWVSRWAGPLGSWMTSHWSSSAGREVISWVTFQEPSMAIARFPVATAWNACRPVADTSAGREGLVLPDPVVQPLQGLEGLGQIEDGLAVVLGVDVPAAVAPDEVAVVS